MNAADRLTLTATLNTAAAHLVAYPEQWDTADRADSCDLYDLFRRFNGNRPTTTAFAAVRLAAFGSDAPADLTGHLRTLDAAQVSALLHRAAELMA